MKFAAFISIIVSVAVMFAACQGVVGPSGKDGADGAKGDAGATGAQGPQGIPGEPGFTPLQLKGTSPFIVINDIDGDDADEVADEAGEPMTIDLTDYFRGGTEPFNYGTPMRVTSTVITDTDNIDAELVDGGPMLKLSVPADTSGDEVNAFTVTITDADDSTVDISISARRNNGPAGDGAAQVATVGSAVPAEAPAMTADCPAFNECAIATTFVDADAMEMLSFAAKSGDTSKVDIVSVKAVSDSNGIPLISSVVVRGIASTWNAGLETPAHEPVTVTITATDRGGMTVEDTVAVTVDGAPRMKGAAMPNRSVKQSSAAQTLIAALSDYFEDPEGETLTYTLKSSNTQAAIVAATDVTDLQVTTNGVGQTDITVTATEPSGDPQQTFSQTFTLTVNPAN